MLRRSCMPSSTWFLPAGNKFFCAATLRSVNTNSWGGTSLVRHRTITTRTVPRASAILDVGRCRCLATKHRRRHFQQQRQAFFHNTSVIRGTGEQQFGGFETMNGGKRGKKKNNEDEDSSHNAMRDSYQETSGNQYSAHLGCQDLLIDCAKRMGSNNSNNNASSWKIADLGSADGSNSIRTLDVFLEAAASAVARNNRKDPGSKEMKDNNSNSIVDDDNQRSSDTIPSVYVVFEEHPSSDRAKLAKTVASWAESRNNNTMDFTKRDNPTTKKTVLTHEVLMKSFYEPLFEANSIDFCMSYICLHWLDSSCMNNDTNAWKGLHLENSAATNEQESPPKQNHGLDEFLQVNERTVPPKLKSIWKKQLADPHLARFLELRTIELKPGAELLIVMVANPHEYWIPLSQQQSSSPLLRAMQECVSEKSLRKEVLEKTVVPYYLREPQDVRDALALAKDRNLSPQHPIHALEIVELRKYETLTGGGDSSGSSNSSMLDGARELFWAIHGGTVQHIGGATDDEMEAIQNRLIQTFDETYNSETGLVKGNFIAAVFRKGDAGQLQ